MDKTQLQDQADQLFNQGIEQYYRSEFREAMQSWSEALTVYKQTDDRKSQGECWGNLGLAYLALGECQEAINANNKSLEIRKAIFDRRGEGKTLGNLGDIYHLLGNYDDAIYHHQQYWQISQETGDQNREAEALNNLGTDYCSQGQFLKALKYHTESLKIFEKISDYRGQGKSLNNLGLDFEGLAKYQEAIDHYEKSLQISIKIDDKRTQGKAIGRLGNVFYLIGKYRDSIIYNKQSLNILMQICDKSGVADALGNIAMNYQQLGEYQKAIKYQNQSLSMAEEIGDQSSKQISLTSLGNTYFCLGQYDKSNNYYKDALKISKKINYKPGEITALVNLGITLSLQGYYTDAINLYRDALKISEGIQDEQSKCSILITMATHYSCYGDYQQSIIYGNQSLEMAEKIGYLQGKANSLYNLGIVHNFLEQNQKAINFLQKSLDISCQIGDRRGESRSLENLGLTRYKMGELDKAEDSLYKSIEIQESLRGGLEDKNKISILDTQQNTYQNLQKVLVKQDKKEDALAISERGRARAFIELLRKRATSDNPEVESQPPDEDRPASIVAQDQNHTLVEYSIMYDNTLYIYVVQPSGEVFYRSFDLDILKQQDNASLKEIISKARISLGVDKDQDGNVIRLETIESDYHPTKDGDYRLLQRLHQILIDPIADLLPTDPNSIITFIPDQDLFLVPFAALQDSDREYLITKHAITIAPSIAVLDQTRQQHRQNQGLKQQSLVVGNPNIHDDIQKDERLYPIPSAEAAARDIAILLRTTEILGADATKVRVMSEMPEKRIIQLFAHALLNDFGQGIPGTIILAPNPDDPSDKGLLNAAEVRSKLKLTAEMVILGCCSSGLGNTNADGVEGLSRCFIEAGTPSIIVSLWDMGVPATKYILTEFYLALKEGMNRAAALRYAMLEGRKRSRHPKSWAPLVLIGETEMLSLDTGTIDLRKLLMTILNDVQPKVLIEAFFAIFETGPSLFSGQAESLQTLRADPTDSLEIIANKIRYWIKDKEEIINSLMDETEQAGRGGSDALPSQDYIDKYNQRLQKNIDRLGMPPSSKSSNKQA